MSRGRARTVGRGRTLAALFVVALAAGWVGAVPGAAQDPGAPQPAAAASDSMHPHLMRDLVPDGPFPRFTPAQLAASGYPDHMHAFFWPDWSPPVGPDGVPYGPGSFCRGLQLIERPGLTAEPGHSAWGPFTLTTNPGYRPCDLMVFLELCDWARVRCRDLLGLEAAGALQLINPDDLPEYYRQSGQGSWRLYKLEGDTCRVEPIPTLLSRTLCAHVAVEVTVLWTLAQTTGEALPHWLRYGLAAYLADMGPHFTNFMAPYRLEGPVLSSPAEIEAALAAPPDSLPQVDQKRFRCSGYGAFLMAWRLVEDHGGLAPLRGLLAYVAGGEALDDACRCVYGTDAAGLAALLDPTAGPEPIGAAVQPRRPHDPPSYGGQ